MLTKIDSSNITNIRKNNERLKSNCEDKSRYNLTFPKILSDAPPEFYTYLSFLS
jgi:hypothetical protein